MKENTVYVVSYIDERYGDEQIVTPFDNCDAANKMYEYCADREDEGYKNVCLDVCEVFHNFYTPEEVAKMTPEEIERIELRD